MKTKLIAIFLTMSMVISLSGCFPNGKKIKDNGDFEKISIEELADLPKHIDETPEKNLIINADVNIEVKNNFNTYTAKGFDYKLEDFCALFFKKDDKVTDSYDNDEYSYKDYGFASAAKYNAMSYDPNSSFRYVTQEHLDKELTYYYTRANNKNGPLDSARDTIFAKKEMDFMSNEAACKLVDEKMQQLGINTAGYKVYSVGYDYIKASDELNIKINEELGITDDFSRYDHVKDDEYYIIMPKIELPNGSVMTEVSYQTPEKDPKKQTCVYSATSLAAVGKKGISNLELNGVYSITEEKDRSKEIIDLNSALEIVKEKYSGSAVEIVIDNIELSYTPYLVNRDEGTFELKPTWMFSVTREPVLDKGSGNRMRNVILVDATEGKEYEIYSELG